MKRVFLIFVLVKTLIYPTQEIGLDSGLKSIILYSNDSSRDTALVIIGGIHGDEIETIDVVYYLLKNLESDLSLYFIPSLNPTLSSIEIEDSEYKILEGRRGYLSDSLDKNGYVIPEKDLSQFSKNLYYRILYGSKSAYNHGIKHYVDPNRDFIKERLPSTRAFKEFIEKDLTAKHNKIVILSIHAYMKGGRIYPEYRIDRDKIIIDKYTMSLAQLFSKGSGYIYTDYYEPAIPIKERFFGELIHYFGTLSNIISFDIELDKTSRYKNNTSVIKGVEAIIQSLEKE